MISASQGLAQPPRLIVTDEQLVNLRHDIVFLPKLPAFADQAWFESNLHLPKDRVDRIASLFAKETRATTSDLELASCKRRADFLPALLRKLDQWAIAFNIGLAAEPDIINVKATKTALAPLFDRAVKILGPEFKPGTATLAEYLDEILVELPTLVDDPETNDFAQELIFGLLIMTVGCPPLCDCVVETLWECTGEIGDFARRFVRDFHETAISAYLKMIALSDDMIARSRSIDYGIDRKMIGSCIALSDHQVEMVFAQIGRTGTNANTDDLANYILDIIDDASALMELKRIVADLFKETGDNVTLFGKKEEYGEISLKNGDKIGKITDIVVDVALFQNDGIERSSAEALLVHMLVDPTCVRRAKLFQIYYEKLGSLYWLNYKLSGREMKVRGQLASHEEWLQRAEVCLASVQSLPLEDGTPAAPLLPLQSLPTLSIDPETTAALPVIEEAALITIDTATRPLPSSLTDLGSTVSEEVKIVSAAEAAWQQTLADLIGEAQALAAGSFPASRNSLDQAMTSMVVLQTKVSELDAIVVAAMDAGAAADRAAGADRVLEAAQVQIERLARIERYRTKDDPRTATALATMLDEVRSAGRILDESDMEAPVAAISEAEAAGVTLAGLYEKMKASEFSPDIVHDISVATGRTSTAYSVAYDALSAWLKGSDRSAEKPVVKAVAVDEPTAAPAVELAAVEVEILPAAARDISLEAGAPAVAEVVEETPVVDASSDLAAEAEEAEEALGEWGQAMARHVADRQFGLAYHLAVAADAVGEVMPFSAPEMRVAAMVGKLNLSTISVSGMPQEVDTALNSVFEIDPAHFPSDETSQARRLLAFAGAIEPALIGRHEAAMLIVERTTFDAGWNKDVFPLKESVRSVNKHGQPLTIELFRSLKDTAEARSDLNDAKSSIIQASSKLARINFGNWPIGAETAKALTNRSGPVGSLVAQLEISETAALNAARNFAERYGTEDAADRLVQSTKESIAKGPSRRVPIIGSFRNVLVGAVMDIADWCAHYVSACAARQELEKAGRKRYDEIRTLLLTSFDAAIVATRSIRPTQAILHAAVATVLEALNRVRNIIDGEPVTQAGSLDHLFALHAPMALVDGMRHGRGWLPAGVDAFQIGTAIVEAKGIALDKESVGAAYNEHVKRGSFSSAQLLIDYLQASGESQYATDLTKSLPASVASVRAEINGRMEQARRTLETIERSGDPAEQDEAARLADRIDIIDTSVLPLDIVSELRTEEDDVPGTIVDFAGVSEVIDFISTRGRSMNARRRTEMNAQLDAVELAQKADRKSIDRVRKIVEADDLVVAAEWISHLEAGVEIPEEGTNETGLKSFFPQVPDFLESQKSNALSNAIEHAGNGRNFGPLAFGRIGAGRRGAARDFLDGFDKLAKVVRDQRATTPAIMRNLVEWFAKLGITTEGSAERVIDFPIGGERGISFQIGLDVPKDDLSSVLPDFGSQTLGRWNLLVAPTLPGEQEIAKFLSGRGVGGSMVIVTSLVPATDRLRFSQACRKHRRKVLVVDMAIAAAAAAEPSLRAGSIIELAQPFSFAAPFRDHGKGAVGELFVGRQSEIELITDPFGPCIVYGARRSGKTATLLHIVGTRHSPETGLVITHLSVQGVGKSEGGRVSDVWSKISEAMPEVFKAKVSTSEAFTDGIRRFLDTKASRRVLLMLDECDDLIEVDAANDYKAFLALQDLMEQSQRRFKVVFAGLQNVSRLARDGNAPLRQLNRAVRIGPFVGAELSEAERLLTRPMAALGFAFASRDLVWRLLSRANYAPSLLQVMAAELVEHFYNRPMPANATLPVIIDETMVRDALMNKDILDKVTRQFFISIEHDRRYLLLANVIASGDLSRAASGEYTEGMTIGEVHHEAQSFWASMFGGIDGLALVEDAVDEMEGLGLIRRVGDDRWALRSPSIRRLLGSRETIERRLEGFLSAPPTKDFDFRQNRRSMSRTGCMAQGAEADHISPLTGSQIDKIFRGENPIMVLSGTDASDIKLAAKALEGEKDGFKYEVHLPATFQRIGDLGALIRKLCAQTGKHLIVIDDKLDWGMDWIREAASVVLNNKRMMGVPEVRVLFVAGATKTMRLSQDQDNRKVAFDWLNLRRWSEGMLDRAGSKFGATLIGAERDVFEAVTGHFNNLAADAMRHVAGVDDKETSLRSWFENEMINGNLLERLGILIPTRKWFTKAGAMVGMGEDLTLKMVQDFLEDCPNTVRFINFAQRIGLASVQTASSERKYVVFNPILKTIADTAEKLRADGRLAA
ncbi:ATP-binding protein [Bosea sp. RAC05]|uniref:ATP-binding protein n=1 Tax=Bosea sp. RAC05 TaxID=1842539 RepID=UPI0008569AE0|nr:ATP-binding protein [Bosea sp. RAC05]AOG03279.1 AAA domain protein [Bosea sp. RAC05]